MTCPHLNENITMKKNVITDKNFLFSLSTDKSLILQNEYKFLICEDLLYESVKDESEKRAKIFSKLGRPYIDYEFIPIIPKLIKFEITYNKPCAKPSSHIEKRDYSINDILANKSIKITSEQQRVLRDLEDDYLRQLEFIIKGFCGYFKQNSQRDATSHMKSLLDGKINDDEYINGIIKEHEIYGAKLPTLSFFTKESICYRYFQVHELWKTDLRMRYQQFEDIYGNPKVILKIKHDYHDLNYLILALLERGFATNEKKLIEWFKLLGDKENLIITNS
ncbi:hypothetical protein VAWG006_27670 [Aeromonas enteropelogenes]|nr:hypothetical protein VAWG006_27670 [Aeromonas enteropelogenes]BEE22676.1 hypothetical protein VAWG007_27710 [Aeromonas enteropelogenes]